MKSQANQSAIAFSAIGAVLSYLELVVLHRFLTRIDTNSETAFMIVICAAFVLILQVVGGYSAFRLNSRHNWLFASIPYLLVAMSFAPWVMVEAAVTRLEFQDPESGLFLLALGGFFSFNCAAAASFVSVFLLILWLRQKSAIGVSDGT